MSCFLRVFHWILLYVFKYCYLFIVESNGISNGHDILMSLFSIDLHIKTTDLTFVSCRSISSVAGDVAACRLTLQGWAVSCPPRSSHVVRCQGADSCVVPLYSLSPSACLPPSSPLRPPGARPNTSSVNPTPDVHGIVGGKLPGHSILALKWNLLSACTRSQVTA